MGEIEVAGPEAERFLDQLVTNDVSRLSPGRVLYSAMCRPDGGVVDDLIIYCRGAQDFLVCVERFEHRQGRRLVSKHAADFDCRVRNVSDDFALLAPADRRRRRSCDR